MPFSAGPNIAARPNLVFEYDTGDVQNSYKGKPTTNFYTNGQFANGAGIPQEGGSNPTNTIIFFPNNPGNSQYVLQQNGNYTEYQIDLTSQLVSNTTYVMSGWYAQSSDYNGSPTMFHARAFSASGNHNATGTGLGTILTTRTVGNTTWSYCYQTITTPSDYSNYFNWYVGYGQPSHNGYRYYTNLQMELGSFPSQFVDGTRSATQGLLDVSGRGTLISLSSVSFTSTAFPQMTFDGTDDQINMDSYASVVPYGGSITVETLVQFNAFAPNDVVVAYGGNGTNKGFLLQYEFTSGLSFSVINVSTGGTAGIGTAASAAYVGKYTHMVGVYNQSQVILYLNGVNVASTNYTGGLPQDTTFRIGNEFARSYYSNMNLPVVRIYDSALSAQEVLRNYNQLKGRFNLS